MTTCSPAAEPGGGLFFVKLVSQMLPLDHPMICRNPLRRLLLVVVTLILSLSSATAEEMMARELLSRLILSSGSAQTEIATELNNYGDGIIKEVIAGWRVGEVATWTQGERTRALLRRADGTYEDIKTGVRVDPGGGEKISRASRKLRKKLRRVVDFLDLNSADPLERIRAVEKLGLSQKAEYLEVLRDRLPRQQDEAVRAAFAEALNITLLKNGNPEEQLIAVQELGESSSFPARDFIVLLKEETRDEVLSKAAEEALQKIDRTQRQREFFGTIVRGLSTGSVLLLVAYGLAITFGLMGVINMAHGEFIAIGGYTVYVVQGWFASAFGEGSAAYESYFLVALPLAFLTAAFCGVLLERGVIQFLHRRPLESLLATWGISMILQQLIRLKFGAANVAVSSPQWLFGSVSSFGISLSYNRLFLVCFAFLVIVGTWVLLNKTSWGLHVRATMQNRVMASCLGVRSARVNVMTFAYGSGLAGLAGAFLSQIGNVGPEMGQTYIVDSFMVVVVGGVGNLMGAAVSSLGIGMVDQALQPLLGPVMGKITVLFAIILFLQFKPGGLFPSRTRSLDE